MDINKLCPGCMREVENKEQMAECPHCGYPLQNPQSAPHQLQPFTILKGKYLIGRVIGEGGFGITYLGYDLTLEITVAIKEFYPNGFVTREANVTPKLTIYAGNNAADIEKWRDNFIREARSLAKFANLNGIVKVQEFFNENETAYIVMEYVDGITVKSYLKQNGGKLPVNQVLQMMEPVIQSLAKVHEKDIIHRDISPDNIMITSNGEMKLLDFGAARDVSGAAEKSLSVMLKPGYAPEEQYRTRGKQGSWSDVYALCATIYKCITGVTPVESMERMRSDSLKRPSELGIAIEPYQEEALMAGMAVYADDRIQNMTALHGALYTARAVQTPPPVSSPLPSTDESVTIPLTGQTQYGTQNQFSGQTQYGTQNQFSGQTQYGTQNQFGGQTQYGAQAAGIPVKKGLGAGVIAAIGGAAVLVIVVIALIVGSIGGNKDKNIQADAGVDSTSAMETATETEPSQEETEAEKQLRYLKEMLVAKDYGELIDEIRYGNLEELADYQDEVTELLRQAVVGHANLCYQAVDEAVESNNMRGIYDVINAEIVYLDSLYEEGIPSDYASIDELYDKADEIKPAYESYVYEQAKNYANSGDEEKWHELFEEADVILGGDGYEHKKATIYAKLVASKSLSIDASQGSRAAMDYINENLALTDNNGYVMELWDVYDHKLGGGGYAMDMRHVVKDGYLLEGSDSRYIESYELDYLTRYEVHLALYEIYARHGRCFTDQQLNGYFGQHSWYHGKIGATEFDETCLNEYEIENVRTIVDYSIANGWFGY